ncbi:interferon alpha/beta receptor 2-like [Engraulis encrasicolus]|uniref:interferon alpha/beta receptor 2-like n=1 Tax=Engraulis encrasicolus TaxID=184585 RepID=UPI002FCFD8DD
MKMLVLLLLLQLWMKPCSCVVPILRPPTNLTVVSVNFNHTLHWIPGPHTPPGTRYNVTCSWSNRRRPRRLGVTTDTSLRVSELTKGRLFETFVFYVASTSGNRASTPANTSFDVIQSVLRPVLVSVEGCGDCLLVN